MLFLASRCLPQTMNKKGYIQQAVLSSSDEEFDNEPFCVEWMTARIFVLFI
jgi:hypothetical protein